MQSILIPGGNSGIGLRAARELVAQGHRVVLLGRDPHKGARALASLGERAGQAAFHAVDLSTHDGVRVAARRVLDETDHLDAILHTTGVLTSQDTRTQDGLHPFFTVNALSRYHLTQLLLPALRRADAPRVVMMTASIPPTDKADFSDLPRFEPFSFARQRTPIQLVNHHYAAHLAATQPSLRAGVVNAGAAKTDILRLYPRPMRALAKVVGPLMFDSLDTSAHNPIETARRTDWPTATYWPKPGQYERRTPITLDPGATRHVIDVIQELTGA